MSLGLKDFDVVVVSIGQDLQSSILTTMILKEIGCKYVVVKARTPLHKRVLEKIGADRVVSPEHDMGLRIAHSLVAKNVMEYLELSPDFSIVEVKSTNDMINKNMQQLKLRAIYGINVIAIKDNRGNINISPGADDIIAKGDILVAVGENRVLAKLGWV